MAVLDIVPPPPPQKKTGNPYLYRDEYHINHSPLRCELILGVVVEETALLVIEHKPVEKDITEADVIFCPHFKAPSHLATRRRLRKKWEVKNFIEGLTSAHSI